MTYNPCVNTIDERHSLPAASISVERYAEIIGSAFIIFYVATWALLPAILGNSINRDTIQIVYWGRELEWGYFKQPPLISWITEAVVRIFGGSDIAIYATSELLMLISFYAVYRLSMKYLTKMQSVMAVMALPVMGYYSYLVPHLNHNIIIIPAWALTTFFAYKAIEERNSWAWVWLGLCIGLGVLGKYTILILPTLIFTYIISSPRHRDLLSKRALWLGVAVCLLVVMPHLVWLIRTGFPTLQYLANAVGTDGGNSLILHIINPVGGLLKMLGMCASLLVAIVGGLGMPRWQLSGLRSRDQFLIVMTLGPVILVVLLSFLTGGEVKNEWATPFFVMLPTLLMLLFYTPPMARQINRFLTWVSGLSVAMILVYLAIYSGILPLTAEAEWARFPVRELSASVSESWRAVCQGPVPAVVGDSWLAGTASYGLPERPRVYTEANRTMAPWMSDRDIRETGAVIVWEADHLGRFREMDHMDSVPKGKPADWFPGLEALELRFGPVVKLSDIVLKYPAVTGLAPVRLSRVVVPPARPCPNKIAALR